MIEEEIEDNTVELTKAMFKAKEAFEKYFEDQGYDAAYWALDLKGYVLSMDFKPLEKVKMMDYSSGTRIDSTWEKVRKND